MRICDECQMLMIEAPINKYDVWQACCCDPKKPMPGARRVVGTAPASSETGPVRIATPAWCRRPLPSAAQTPPPEGEARQERRLR